MTFMRFMKTATLGLVAVATLGVVAGAGWEVFMRRNVLRTIAMPGRLVEVSEGRRIHLDCRGGGSPTVVLESGLDIYGSLAWAAVHDSLAGSARVCAYSRAGIMWSDAASGAFDARESARDLHAALRNAGESAPWVMVGHSLGGPYAMIFTAMYESEVAGMVLVDASHPDQFARFEEATGKVMLPSAGEVKIGAALAWTGIVRLLPATPMPPGWPTAVGESSHAFLGLSLRGLAREIDAIPATLAAAGSNRSLGDRPLVVISAGKELSDEEVQMLQITPEQNARRQAAALALQADQASWGLHSRQEVVADASHYIQFDRPDVVIRGVREVVAAVRK